MFPCKQRSDTQNRKPKRQEQVSAKILLWSLDKYFPRSENVVESDNQNNSNDEPIDNSNSIDSSNDPFANSNNSENEFAEKPKDFNISYPRLWDEIDLKKKLHIEKWYREIETNNIFSKDMFNRHVSCKFYVRKLRNSNAPFPVRI